MDSVAGSDTGYVHKQRTGTGLATVLQGDEALSTYRHIYDLEWQRAQRLDSERRAKMEAARTKLRNVNPDFFYKHKPEIERLQNDMLTVGTTLVGRQRDPFTDTSAEGVDFQKKFNRLMNMAAASKQVGQQYSVLQQELVGGKENDYRAEDIERALSFFDRPLDEIVSKGMTMPALQKKAPATEMSNFLGMRAKEWMSALDQPPSDNDIDKFVLATATDEGNMPKFVQGYGDKLLQMDEDERKGITARAIASGRHEWQQMAFEDVKRWQKRGEPFDVLKEYGQIADRAMKGISMKTYEGPTGFSTKPEKGSKESAIEKTVDAALASDPRWLEVFDATGDVPRLPNTTDQEYKKLVRTFVMSQVEPLVAVDQKSGTTARGKDESEAQKGRQDFLAAMRSGDFARMQGAANILIGTPYSANLKIEDATVTQGRDNYWLELDLGANVSTKDIKEQITDPDSGFSTENARVENRQGRTVVTISLDPQAIENQTFVRLHDNMMKQTGKAYDDRFTERTPETYDATGTAPKVITPFSQPQKKSMWKINY